MTLEAIKGTLKLIKEFQDKDYFYDEDAVKNKIQHRDQAIARGQVDAKKYSDDMIRRWVYKNTRNKTFHHTAMDLYKAIKEGDIDKLISRVRYDQHLTIKLYKLYTGEKLPRTNGLIREYIKKHLSKTLILL